MAFWPSAHFRDFAPEWNPKYPEIEVDLVGLDGDTEAVLDEVQLALLLADVPLAEVMDFADEAMSGDFAHLRMTVGFWVRATWEAPTGPVTQAIGERGGPRPVRRVHGARGADPGRLRRGPPRRRQPGRGRVRTRCQPGGREGPRGPDRGRGRVAGPHRAQSLRHAKDTACTDRRRDQVSSKEVELWAALATEAMGRAPGVIAAAAIGSVGGVGMAVTGGLVGLGGDEEAIVQEPCSCPSRTAAALTTSGRGRSSRHDRS